MDIPYIVCGVAFVFVISSLVFEILVGFASAVSFLLDDDYYLNIFDSLFGLCLKIRNAGICFLVLLFFILTGTSLNNGVSKLGKISYVCQFLSIGSIIVFAIGIIICVILILKNLYHEDIKKYARKIWVSGLTTSIFSFLVAYLFDIP